MAQTVELLLDDALDTAVRGEWARLLEAGIDSQARVRAESNRPHITLFVARAVPLDVEPDLRPVTADIELDLRLGGFVVFGGRHATLARLVVPTAALLDLQAQVFEALSACPGVPAHIRPGEWTPHVTLARRVPASQVGAAIVAAHPAGRDLTGRSAGVRRWDGDAKHEWRV